MKKIGLLLIALMLTMTVVSCQKKEKEPHPLQVSLEQYIDTCHAKIGVAVILPDSDTIVVNDGHYPMNSVVKLFQDFPSAQVMIKRGLEMMDTVWVSSSELYNNFYSPMLDVITDSSTAFTWKSLFEYALIKSDNNASDLLFKNLSPIDSVVTYWKDKGIQDFDIKWTEADIHQEHSRSDQNWTTPLAAARVISYTAPYSMISSNYTVAVAGGILMACETGSNRISKPLNPTNALVFHKTGTGFNDNEGHPTSVNDVAYILLPSGKVYTLAVFVLDSQADMEETEAMIAHISEMVLQYIWDQSDDEADAKAKEAAALSGK